MCAHVGRWRSQGPRPVSSTSSTGAMAVSFSGSREVGVTPVHRMDNQRTTPERLCSDRLAQGQVQGAAHLCKHQAGPGSFRVVFSWVSPWAPWMLGPGPSLRGAIQDTGGRSSTLGPPTRCQEHLQCEPQLSPDMAQDPLGTEPPQLGTIGVNYF